LEGLRVERLKGFDLIIIELFNLGTFELLDLIIKYEQI